MENKKSGMTREQLYKSIKVVKGNHWCRICDVEADFVIVNPNVYGDGNELPLDHMFIMEHVLLKKNRLHMMARQFLIILRQQ